MKSKEDIKTSVGQRKLGQVKECLSQLHVNSLEAICQNGMGISLDSIISSPTHAYQARRQGGGGGGRGERWNPPFGLQIILHTRHFKYPTT